MCPTSLLTPLGLKVYLHISMYATERNGVSKVGHKRFNEEIEKISKSR
jgi:hypothetical protein